MNWLKQQLRRGLRAAARRIATYPRFKQIILGLVKAMPSEVEARLGRALRPSSQLHGQRTGIQIVSTLSPTEARLTRDLRNQLACNRRRDDSVTGKPRLAYLSPLPPQRSGISNYSQMLLPRLAHHYAIDVIVDLDEIADPWITENCTLRSPAWFREHGGEFDRILYHLGNAPFHAHMLDLLETWPGAVVLHDFFLGHLILNIDARSPGYLGHSLYRGWGYSALLAHRDDSKEQLIWEYPLNAGVLDNALGLIVHSDYNRELASRYFGARCQQDWHVIPHLREPAPTIARAGVRQKLGLPEDALVVCSFGHITPTKLPAELIEAWQASLLATDSSCWLIFVGELPEGPFGESIDTLVRQSGNPRICITGWTDNQTFANYLAAADIAVQLRTQSRGETSGAAIDCLNNGLATLVNAHGTMRDLPADAVCFIPDGFSTEELTAALEKLRAEPDFRQQLGSRARAAIRSHHDPDVCGDLYHRAIEDIYRRREPYQTALGAALAGLPATAFNDLSPLARKLLETTPLPDAGFPGPLTMRQLLVDVSSISRTDLRTGIERVVRAQLLELMRHPPEGYRIEPVYLQETAGTWHYHYGRFFSAALLGLDLGQVVDEKVDFAAGDILYIPDFFAHGVIHAHRQGLFTGIKARGTTIQVLIHDILPVTHPDCFPPSAPQIHTEWLLSISAFADRLICISRAVADEYLEWAKASELPLNQLPAMAINHHGADISASNPTKGIPRKGKKILQQLSRSPTFLMVGTIEPRKGHLETLEAFDQLWQSGTQVNLIIVGPEGWKDLPDNERRTIPEIVKRLDWHPQRNKKLFWLASISDEFLEAVYAHSDCLIAASFDEGFGLPLIEAAQHHLSIIARDIPVFREIAGNHARYFNSSSSPLAATLVEWLSNEGLGSAPTTEGMPVKSWRDNVSSLKDLLMSQET